MPAHESATFQAQGSQSCPNVETPAGGSPPLLKAGRSVASLG